MPDLILHLTMRCIAVALLLVARAAAFAPAGRAAARGARVSMSVEEKTTTGVARNPNFAKLQAGYLFPEIGRRRREFAEKNPDLAEKVISLGIGDTTQPIPKHILGGLQSGVGLLGDEGTYSGYGAEQGRGDLREKIADKLYGGRIAADEVFVSDGAKCDISRLQLMFGAGVTSAVQDPSYPVCV